MILVSFNSVTTGATSGTGNAYPSRASELTHSFCQGFCGVKSLVFCIVFFLDHCFSFGHCIFCHRFTASDQPFGIFKLCCLNPNNGMNNQMSDSGLSLQLLQGLDMLFIYTMYFFSPRCITVDRGDHLYIVQTQIFRDYLQLQTSEFTCQISQHIKLQILAWCIILFSNSNYQI